MEDYERRNGQLPGHEKVGSWLHDVQAAYASDGPSPNPTPPGAQHTQKDQYVSDSQTHPRSTAVTVCAEAAGRNLTNNLK